MRPLVLSCLFAACSAPTPARDAGVALVPWQRVERANEAATFEVPARVVGGPDSASVVSAPLRATVLKVRVRVGDVVDAGTPLLDVVMPELLDAAGRLEGARVRLEAWNARLEQVNALRAEGLARSLEVSEAASRVAEAKAEVQSARAVLLAAGVREQDAAAVLNGAGTWPLRAPRGGVVTQVSVTAGEHREPGSGALVYLASEAPVRVEARFVASPGLAQYRFVGGGHSAALTLISHAPNTDARDGTTLAWFEADRPLPANVPGVVQVSGSGDAQVWRVPAAAIHRMDAGVGVETKGGLRTVEVARCETTTCLVRGALNEGDDVRVP